MTTTIIKMPKTVPAFATVAAEIGMNAGDLISDLDRAFGEHWCNEPSFSVSTLGVQDSGEVVPPAGYELAEGVTDIYVGPETLSSAFVIRASWHAVTGLFSVEVTPADGLGDFQTLAPDEALKLATDIKTVTESVRPVNISAGALVAV